MRIPNRAEDPAGHLAAILGPVVVGVWVAAFVLCGIFDQSAGSWGHALSLTLGTVDPFVARSAPGKTFAIVLALVSWLLVPLLLGSAAALLIDNHLRGSRPGTRARAQTEAEKEAMALTQRERDQPG